MTRRGRYYFTNDASRERPEAPSREPIVEDMAGGRGWLTGEQRPCHQHPAAGCTEVRTEWARPAYSRGWACETQLEVRSDGVRVLRMGGR